MVFVAINISPDEGVRLEVDLGEGRTDYLLTPDEDGYESRAMLLNGERMSIIEGGGRLPEPRGIERGRDERVLLMPPISIAFVVVHGAEVKVCD